MVGWVYEEIKEGDKWKLVIRSWCDVMRWEHILASEICILDDDFDILPLDCLACQTRQRGKKF